MSGSSNRDVKRRSWDVAAFAERARERAVREAEDANRERRNTPIERTLLDVKGRSTIAFEERVGSTEIISHARAGGFFCEICNSVLKDSNRYLAHVNSRAHQKMLGMSMRVKRSTLQEVKDAFEEERLKLRSKSDVMDNNNNHDGDTRKVKEDRNQIDDDGAASTFENGEERTRLGLGLPSTFGSARK